MKFSLWPFRRKKVLDQESEPPVQSEGSTAGPDVELQAAAVGKLSQIEDPQSLPTLGNSGGWDKMRIGLAEGQPGVIPFAEQPRVSGAQSDFIPMIDTGEFTSHLAGLSSFNLSEIMPGKNERLGFPQELPQLDNGLTDILAQPGSLAEQMPGWVGIAPILSVAQPAISRKVLDPFVDEHLQGVQKEQQFVRPASLELTYTRLANGEQTPEPERGIASLPLINPQITNPPSLISRSEPWGGITPQASSMTILLNAETILPVSNRPPAAGAADNPENFLINSNLTGENPEGFEQETGIPHLEFSFLTGGGLGKPADRPTDSGLIQLEKEDFQNTADNFSDPLGIKTDIARMVTPSSELPVENETVPLVFLNSGAEEAGNDPQKPIHSKLPASPLENLPSSRVNLMRADNQPGIIGTSNVEEMIQINSQPVQMSSAVQNLILRQSLSPEQMMVSLPTIQAEAATGIDAPASPLSILDLQADQELNPMVYSTRAIPGLIQGIGQTVEKTGDIERLTGRQPQEGEPDLSFIQLEKNEPISRINREEPSIARFAMPGQVPGMSLLENSLRGTDQGSSQELQTVQSARMPLFNQGQQSAAEIALGGGLPQMPLPPSIGETLAAMNPSVGSIGQNVPELAEKAAAKDEQSEIANLPNIDRLTDQIWHQIQRRLQVERERSRGMA
ncbi:MAG: hypothetical protein P4L50_26220 [Anaerolineaceae bacterium]|nr:hypothetical protein [Anaerolineaceae bacterium]